jgi:hypothetical protein
MDTNTVGGKGKKKTKRRWAAWTIINESVQVSPAARESGRDGIY